MQESSVKTTLKQRIVFIVVAFILLFSSIAIYILTVFGKEKSPATDKVSEAEIQAYMAEYEAKMSQMSGLVEPYSSEYLERMISYKPYVKSFNSVTANESGVQIEDVAIGDGDTLTSTSTGYGAYYIGWCSNEKVFDSSFDDFATPGKLVNPLIVEESSLIAGWYQGVDGMRLGGARIVTIPGALAYGDSRNPCDESSDERNVPLKFIIVAFPVSDEIKTVSKEAQEAYLRYMYAAMYGIKYE